MPAQAARSRAPLLLPGVAAEHGPLPPPWPQAPGAQCPVPLHRHPCQPRRLLAGDECLLCCPATAARVARASVSIAG